MRELKFRAWDNQEKCYAYTGFHIIGEIMISGGIDIWISEHEHSKGYLERYNDFVIEQYTGLKDKNGKEIYEGDICKFDKPGWVDCFAIIWLINGWHKRWLRLDCSYLMNETDPQHIIVIGNIHQNPELIKEAE